MQLLYILLCAYQFIYKYRYLKAKVIRTNFLGNDNCKNHSQVYLKECKCGAKKYKYVQIHKH